MLAAAPQGLESQRGLEPLSLPWQGSVCSHLHYCDLVEALGVEPRPDSLSRFIGTLPLSYAPTMTDWSRREDSNPQRSVYPDPSGLYPVSYAGVVRPVGFEPTSPA